MEFWDDGESQFAFPRDKEGAGGDQRPVPIWILTKNLPEKNSLIRKWRQQLWAQEQVKVVLKNPIGGTHFHPLALLSTVATWFQWRSYFKTWKRTSPKSNLCDLWDTESRPIKLCYGLGVKRMTPWHFSENAKVYGDTGVPKKGLFFAPFPLQCWKRVTGTALAI